MLSLDADAITDPSGENATASTECECLLSVYCSWPDHIPHLDGFVARRRCHSWPPFWVVDDAVFGGKYAVLFTNHHLAHGSLLSLHSHDDRLRHFPPANLFSRPHTRATSGSPRFSASQHHDAKSGSSFHKPQSPTQAASRMALLSNPIVRPYRCFVRHATCCNRKYRSLDSLTERQVQAGQSERGYDLPRTLPVFWSH